MYVAFRNHLIYCTETFLGVSSNSILQIFDAELDSGLFGLWTNNLVSLLLQLFDL